MMTANDFKNLVLLSLLCSGQVFANPNDDVKDKDNQKPVEALSGAGSETVKLSGKISQEETQGVVSKEHCASAEHRWKKKLDANSGNLFHACYLKNKVDGKVIYYSENGKIIKTGIRQNDKNQGRWTRYYDDGKIRDQGQWLDDAPHGDWELFYPNGQIKSEGEFQNGKKIGEWTDFHENGKKQSRGAYRDGKKWGDWKYWSETGQVIAQGVYACDSRRGQWKEREGEQLTTKSYPEDPCGNGETGEVYAGKFLHFRGGGLAMFQGDSGRNYSVYASWHPTLVSVFSFLDLRSMIAFSFLRNSITDSVFVRGQTGLLLAWKLSSKYKLDLETGVTLQRYFSDGADDVTPASELVLVKKLNQPVLFVFTHFWVGYSHVFFGGNVRESDEYKLGLAVDL